MIPAATTKTLTRINLVLPLRIYQRFFSSDLHCFVQRFKLKREGMLGSTNIAMFRGENCLWEWRKDAANFCILSSSSFEFLWQTLPSMPYIQSYQDWTGYSSREMWMSKFSRLEECRVAGSSSRTHSSTLEKASPFSFLQFPMQVCDKSWYHRDKV